MKALLGLGLVSVLSLLVAGCHNCEKLAERMCTDLGPEDCAAWREAGGPEAFIPHGSRPNKTCGMIMDIDASYQGLLNGAAKAAVGIQLRKAQAAKDEAKIIQLTAKQAKLTAEFNAAIAKLRQN